MILIWTRKIKNKKALSIFKFDKKLKKKKTYLSLPLKKPIVKKKKKNKKKKKKKKKEKTKLTNLTQISLSAPWILSISVSLFDLIHSKPFTLDRETHGKRHQAPNPNTLGQMKQNSFFNLPRNPSWLSWL